jgi:ABC-type glycerol-3-phosphate transport system substrate-binding protein
MKFLILAVFLVLCGLSAVALWTQPRPPHPEKISLVRSSDYHPRRSAELAAFNQAHPNLWASLDATGNQPQKIIVQCSSGVGPDLFDVWGGTQIQTFAESGIVYDLTDKAPSLGFSLEDTWPAVRGELSDQGRQYSYPANVNVNILVYNKTVFDQMGVPYPAKDLTWEQFWALAEKVTRRDGARTVFGVAQMGWTTFFQSRHGEYFSPDGTRLLLTGDALREAFQMHHDMLYKYRVSPSAIELKALSGQGGFGSGGINQFADGRFAMINVGKWALSNFRSAYKDQTTKRDQWQKNAAKGSSTSRPDVIQLGSVLLPHFTGQAPCYVVSSKSTAINALSPHRTEALQFLQYMASKTYSEIINEGVDALPGNPKFVNAGLKTGEPALSEIEMHQNTIASMKYGYQPKRSPFLLTSDVERVLNEQISRIESDPDLPVETTLTAAQSELRSLMQRNLDRDPKLRARYKALTGSERALP